MTKKTTMIRSMKLAKLTTLFMIMTILIFTVGCQKQAQAPEAAQPEATQPAPAEKATTIVLATTTSTAQTGLLDAIIPEFAKKTGIEVKVVAVGSGQAIEMGKSGEADVLLVHAKASEEKFIEEGYGLARHDVMYNDFILVGPDTSDIKLPDGMEQNIVSAMKHIQEKQIPFISRGDDSGTHKKELAIWKKAGLEPTGQWYVSAGKGMGEVLQMADEKKAYTLTDRGTYLSMKDKLALKIVVEKDKDLLNQYGVIAVNPAKNPTVHEKEALQFVEWILSKETQDTIGAFGVKEFGQQLFVPNAKE